MTTTSSREMGRPELWPGRKVRSTTLPFKFNPKGINKVYDNVIDLAHCPIALGPCCMLELKVSVEGKASYKDMSYLSINSQNCASTGYQKKMHSHRQINVIVVICQMVWRGPHVFVSTSNDKSFPFEFICRCGPSRTTC